VKYFDFDLNELLALFFVALNFVFRIITVRLSNMSVHS